MSKLLAIASSLGLKVTDSKISDMDEIIFGALVIKNLPNITVADGKHYRLNTKNNSAEEITAKTLSKAARKALDKGKDADGSLKIAEDFGLINSVQLDMADDVDSNGRTAHLLSVCDALNLKVKDVQVAVQNEIIFKERGISNLSSLTKSGKEYYVLDTKKNTATLINPEAVAAQAVKDLKKGKSSDYTNLAQDFCLITSVTLVKNKD